MKFCEKWSHEIQKEHCSFYLAILVPNVTVVIFI